jgi:6-pyruvoyltetrahydropterin/6-carboxytetrahydropterin synthase
MFEVTVEAGFLLRPLPPQLPRQVREPARPQLPRLRHAHRRELDETGLLLDFKLLKQVLRPVVDYLDHQMINDLKPFDELNPSAENLARYFYEQTSAQLTR